MKRQKRYRVTGVFIHDPWEREPIEREVEAPHADYAISIVHGEALKADLLFLSAKAEIG
jgi:hypothetical protein